MRAGVLDAIAESRVVRDLIGGGLTSEQVGNFLGRSDAWVRRRARLVNLSPKIMKLLAEGEPLARWPIAWLEDLASVPLVVQERLCDGKSLGYIEAREQLQERLFESTSDLGRVPWDLDEVDLVKAAGSCTACPKRSAHAPGLFDLVDRAG